MTKPTILVATWSDGLFAVTGDRRTQEIANQPVGRLALRPQQVEFGYCPGCLLFGHYQHAWRSGTSLTWSVSDVWEGWRETKLMRTIKLSPTARCVFLKQIRDRSNIIDSDSAAEVFSV